MGQFLYGLNLHWLLEGIEAGEDIDEPEPISEYVIDLTGAFDHRVNNRNDSHPRHFFPFCRLQCGGFITAMALCAISCIYAALRSCTRSMGEITKLPRV